MRILIVANHYAVCSARYAADAFTRLGHSVKHIGPDMGTRIWGLELPARYAWSPDVGLVTTDATGRTDCDLIIVMDSDPAILDYAQHWDYAPRIVFGVDNHCRDYRRPWFAHYFLAHRAVSVMPWGDDMTHLPCAMDPTLFTPSPIPWAERAYDVACLGVMYPARRALVKAMQDAGLKVLWGCGLVYESYAAALQNSRVALCQSAAGDLAQRVFESAACGCAVLSDPLADLNAWQEERPLHPILLYRTVEEAVAGARHLQERPDKAIEAAAWAAPHTWDARAQVIVDWHERTHGG